MSTAVCKCCHQSKSISRLGFAQVISDKHARVSQCNVNKQMARGYMIVTARTKVECTKVACREHLGEEISGVHRLARPAPTGHLHTGASAKPGQDHQ